eukprot:5369747-Pyramimonas_sp.AAC.1
MCACQWRIDLSVRGFDYRRRLLMLRTRQDEVRRSHRLHSTWRCRCKRVLWTLYALPLGSTLPPYHQPLLYPVLIDHKDAAAALPEIRPGFYERPPPQWSPLLLRIVRRPFQIYGSTVHPLYLFKRSTALTCLSKRSTALTCLLYRP